jgi:hypothetical protein
MNTDTGQVYWTAEEVEAAKARGEPVVDISEDLATALAKLEAETGRSLPDVVEEARARSNPPFRQIEGHRPDPHREFGGVRYSDRRRS